MKLMRILQGLVVMVAAALVALVLASDLVGPDRRVLDGLEAERASLELRTQAHQAYNDRLRQEVRGLKDSRPVLEQRIREDLGYVRDDEVVVVVPR
jgi:cell division protein FtsB